ncbi:MAG: CPBP family intramembrane metalloprotease [Bacteroidetes bacterium]|nr:MAG: CPBP family intramembrane metalloprotease [Bacteroidota bacterium]TNE96227.1 MAG: CPBP family intramembrane metalloprotease [Bacteroidota bacterium]
MKKSSVYLMGLITLLVFPIPTFLVLYFWEEIPPVEVFQLEKFDVIPVGYGLQFGFIYAIFALLLLRSSVFDGLPKNIEHIVRSMKLSIFDSLFLSLCAGIGEELLFRSGFQYYFDPFLVSIFFIAIHGYFNPMSWRMSLYGLILLPFIVLISYGYYEFGLWFSISAHFMYDFVVFMSIRK